MEWTTTRFVLRPNRWLAEMWTPESRHLMYFLKTETASKRVAVPSDVPDALAVFSLFVIILVQSLLSWCSLCATCDGDTTV